MPKNGLKCLVPTASRSFHIGLAGVHCTAEDYNATTTQSDYGDNLHRLFDYLRLKARYDRAAWLLKPLNLVHETLARRDGALKIAKKKIELMNDYIPSMLDVYCV